ncbi:MAG: hypothetical protein ABMA15_04310 [Vicinamibacterales bacterium]
MPRLQDDDLLGLGLAELLNFVNTGQCDGGVVSLFWPFDDARYKPRYSDVSLSLPNLKAGRRGWPELWPSTTQPVHRALRRALDDQLARVVKGKKPVLPTQPGWTRRSFVHLSPIEAATVTAMRCAFDDVLGSASLAEMGVSRCAMCTLFFAAGREAGRPSHFCTQEHRDESRHTDAFKKKQATQARERRAIERDRAVRAARAVALNPTRKTRI